MILPITKKRHHKMTHIKAIPSISVNYTQNGSSKKSNELGMRVMQERAYEKRGEQYLLIKSPPASGKSRALMFIALDKLNNQNIKKAIITVPEKSIGASFSDESLIKTGFHWDWKVNPRWNLCNSLGSDGGKATSVKAFLESDDHVLVCPHATFRNAIERFGIEGLDNCLVAVDEFHHVSANPDNKLGNHVGKLIERGKTHIVAMTGSYFRGDAEAVLAPDDEAKFETVTYTYYEQLNGYDYLKTLDIGYYFYSGLYSDSIIEVLDPNEKTILHIPSVNARESEGDKYKETEHIMDVLGTYKHADPITGFQIIETKDGRLLKIADLVDDSNPAQREKVQAALRTREANENRDYVDIIIALGMAKEGFDWIWCEHALTVGYRSSLTEIIQIIGRATRDAKGKTRARFTNLIAEPDASEELVTDAINDTLKAIAASLLMEQVLAPRFNFVPKNKDSGPIEGFDYGEEGYNSARENVGFNNETGQIQIEIKGLAEPKSEAASRIVKEDLNEVIAAFVQDKDTLERGMFDEEIVPEELTQVRMGKVISEKYPDLDNEDQEAVRQHAVAALNLTQKAKEAALKITEDGDGIGNTALIDGVKKFVMDVRDLDIDMIDRINPFGEAYAILAKSMDEENLRKLAAIMTSKKSKITPDDAKIIARRAVDFKRKRGRLPSLTAVDPYEKHLAEGAEAYVRFKDEGRYD